MNPKERLILALDVPSAQEAEAVVKAVGDEVHFFKIGYQLVFAGGLEFASELSQSGKKVFLDMKLLDIDNTIAKAVENIVKMNLDMLTLHAYPKAMAAAVEAAKGSDLCLLGVTVLTSMDDADLVEAGYSDIASDMVERRVAQAKRAGMGGVVASALEAERIREIIGNDMAVVTPGIRPLGGDVGDQKRVMTPGRAIKAGASHLVVGRPIVAAEDPRSAAALIQSEIADAVGVAS